MVARQLKAALPSSGPGTTVPSSFPFYKATSTTQKNKVRVSRLGRDQTLMLREGDWVELGRTRVS